MEKKYYYGREVEVRLDYYPVADFMGRERIGLALSLEVMDEQDGDKEFGKPTDLIFTVNFGEFIGVKDAAYLDTYNFMNIVDWLTKEGFGKVSGLKKYRGRHECPLFFFNSESLRELDAEKYEEYASQYGA